MWDKTLQLFEGKGGDIRENLYAKYTTKCFAGCYFIIASNRLPDMAVNINTSAYKEQWLPLESRINLVHLPETFTGRTFSYNTIVLALALKAMIDSKGQAIEEYMPGV